MASGSYVPRRFAESKLEELPVRFGECLKAEIVADFAKLWAHASTPREMAEVAALWSAEVERIGKQVLAEILAEIREYAVEGSA